MLKIEYIWRELLYQAIEKNNSDFNISSLANKFDLSTSMVAYSLSPLRDLHMVEVGKTKSKIIDAEKLLMFWATRRNINKEIIYMTYSLLPVFEREAQLPATAYPTAYSASHLYYDDLPADYDNIYFYCSDIEEIKRRYPQNQKKNPNLFILQPDKFLFCYKQTTMAQIYSDLWSLPEWYAREFSNSLLNKIKGKIGL